MSNQRPPRTREAYSLLFAGSVILVGTAWLLTRPTPPDAPPSSAHPVASNQESSAPTPTADPAPISLVRDPLSVPAPEPIGPSVWDSPILLSGGMGVTGKYRYQNAKEIQSRVVREYPDGSFDRERILEVDFKYPNIRVEEVVLHDEEQGGHRVVHFLAMVADHMIVKVEDEAQRDALDRLNQQYGYSVARPLSSENTYIVDLGSANLDSLPSALSQFGVDGDGIEFAEPDYLVYAISSEPEDEPSMFDSRRASDPPAEAPPEDPLDDLFGEATTPDDTSFGSLWGMSKIRATQAWDYSTGSSDIVCGVIDTGVDYDHPDLLANRWVNTGETPGNATDDDGNGFVDDVYGYDFYHNDGDPDDDHYHGTHCAGTVGGVGNNASGIVGVAWTCKMMALKFLGPSGGGSTSDAIDATNYATDNGAHLTSNSWGGGGFSTSLKSAIDRAATTGNAVFVAAAGNSNRNNDRYPHYPSSYKSANIIAVASTTSSDARSSFSCYGRRSVDLGAPGSSILSTFPVSRGSYSSISGTSMATPHVAGACVLLLSMMPTASWRSIKSWITKGVDKKRSMRGITQTGGRLNVFKSVRRVPRLRMAGFAAQTSVHLSWSDPSNVGEASDTVFITRRTDAFPTSYNVGEQVYTGTAYVYEDTGLTPGQTYYYRIWADDGASGQTTPQFGSVYQVSATPDNGSQMVYWRDRRGTMTSWALGADGDKKGVARTHTGRMNSNWTMAGMGDIDGNGVDDMVWHHTNGTVSYWMMDDNGKYLSGGNVVGSSVNSSWSIKASGDVDGDGTMDLIWYHTAGWVRCWFLNSNGTYASHVNVRPTKVGRVWSLVGSGDVNNDGTLDLIWRHNNGRMQCWFLKTDGTMNNAATIRAGRVARNQTLKGVADIDADGYDDLLWIRNGVVSFWLLNSNGTYKSGGNVRTNPISSAWSVEAFRDVNADGTADVILKNSNGTLSTWFLASTGAFNTGGSAGRAHTSWTVSNSGL